MLTKQEVLDSIQANISSKIDAETISPEILGDVIADAVNLVNPSFAEGDAVPTYSIDNQPIYQKVFFENDGSLLDQIDLGLPAEARVLSIDKSYKPEMTILGENFDMAVGVNTHDTNSNQVVLKSGTLSYDGVEITSADVTLTYTYKTFTSETLEQTLTLSYSSGSDLILNITLPTAASISVKSVTFSNCVGLEPFGFGKTFDFDMEIAGELQSFSYNQGNIDYDGTTVIASPSNVSIFEYHVRAASYNIVATGIGVTANLDSITIDSFADDAVINIKVTYSDNTTETVNLVYDSNGKTLPITLAKDITTLDQSLQHITNIELLDTSSITLNGDTGNIAIAKTTFTDGLSYLLDVPSDGLSNTVNFNPQFSGYVSYKVLTVNPFTFEEEANFPDTISTGLYSITDFVPAQLTPDNRFLNDDRGVDFAFIVTYIDLGQQLEEGQQVLDGVEILLPGGGGSASIS